MTTRYVKRHLDQVDVEEFLDIAVFLGNVRLTEFARWIQRTAKKYGWTADEVIEACLEKIR